MTPSTPPTDGSIDRIWKALADPTRRAILDQLAKAAQTTGDLCTWFAAPERGGLGRTGTMKHLGILHEAGLVVVRREGRTRWNFLNPVPIQQVCDRWVSRHVAGLATSLQRLKTLAENPGIELPHPPARRIDDVAARPLRASRLSNDHVRLATIDADRDAPELFACSHGSGGHEAIWQYMGYGPFRNENAMRSWLANCAESTDPKFFVVRARTAGATARPVGMAAFLAIDRDHRRVELGHIWYGAATHRTTINTAVTYAMLREAFERGYRRVEWKCDAENARSCQAALRLGFAFEGIFRQHMVVKERNRDTAWFAMLDSEWPAARAALEAWLSWQGDDRPALAALRAG